MNSLYVCGNKRVEVAEVPALEPKDNVVVVKIMASILCGINIVFDNSHDA